MSTQKRRRGRGEGSIYKRKDGRWEGRFDVGIVNGARKRKPVYGRTRHEVAEKLTALAHARKAGLPFVDERTSVADFLHDWLDVVKPTVRPRTWQRYSEYVRLHASPSIGHIRLSKLSPSNLQHLYAERLGTGLSPQSVVHLHRILHKALKQAMRWGLVARNVTELVDPPRVPKKEMRALTPDEAERLLSSATGNPLEALYVLAVTTGMREGELLALRWKEVDLNARTLSVVGSLQSIPGQGLTIVEPKTARSRRLIVMSTLATDALRAHRAEQAKQRLTLGTSWHDNDLVFPNGTGNPMNPSNLLRRSFQPLLERAGLPRIRFHDLRHTAATLLLSQGMHPKVVSEMLGHSDTGITLDLYSHVTPTMLQQAADAFDALFGRQFGRQTGSE
jgi:integrase